VFYCTYDQYAEKWDEIAAIFARDAILKGSFDKYADSAKKKKGTAEVDTAFLEEIERWRDLLARNFALRNPTLNVRDLNFAVQKTIDRLVFLRICEDRGTEDYGRLRNVANGTQTYQRLLELFRAADARYNSGLFHFSKEKGQAEEPDTLTPDLALDDKVLKDIIAHLYYPDSPYEFSVLPADILGSVYERFLGKTIRLTDGHQAKIEEKPEVRKAGGVYYTPSYIVDYIVQNTLGKLLTPETEKPISLPEAAKLKVVDPACGSGSFLIVAYQFLLDWHRNRYAENPKKWSKGKNATLYQAKGDEWRLTAAEKKRILLNNIHGVDIDAAAVEVTKLSLLLKVLEGETGEIAQRDFLKERERILPNLANNIKCGNSLIGSDFYDQPGLPEMDTEDHLRINVFDWDGKDGFPKIMKAGGFDAVIGNPPYIFTRELISAHERDYYASRYILSWEKHNTFMLFMEAILRLLRSTGRGSFIVPNSWLTIESGKNIRQALIPKLLGIIDFNFPVFQQVSMEPCIFVMSGDICDGPVASLRIASKDEFLAGVPILSAREQWNQRGGRISVSASEELSNTFKFINDRCSTVGECFEVKTGLQAYEKGKGIPRQTASDVANHVFDCWEKIDPTTIRYLEGKDVGRYQLRWSGMWMRYGPWLSQPRELSQFTRPRIVIREITGQFPELPSCKPD
jgi:type I restriction-modification system DNA methylase subunit